MHHSWALRVLGVGKTIAPNVIFALRILSSETIAERFVSSTHSLISTRYPKLANPVPPTHQGLGPSSVVTSPHANLHQQNNHPTFASQLRRHGLSSDRGISPPPSPNVPYTKYAFVELLSLSSEDVAYLSSNGCLTLPGSNALDEFVKEYFKRIHPLVPVLDEAEFWRIYQKNQSTGSKVSLLVLRSLLVASCPVSSIFPSYSSRHFD